jgi:hypothetical protein
MLELNRIFWPKTPMEINKKKSVLNNRIGTNIDFLPIPPLFFQGKNKAPYYNK